MTNNGAALLKMATTNTASLRERAIAQYHNLLLCDETLTPATFEKLRSAIRKDRLLYGDRPISVALRPHFLERSQFETRTRSNTPLSTSSALPNIISTGDCPHSRHGQRIEGELRDLLLQSGRNLC
jgi:hypothetical protein